MNKCANCGQHFSEIYKECPHCHKTKLIEIEKTRLEHFDCETQTITSRRGADYGPPSVDFDRAMRLKSVVAECSDTLVRHVLETLCVKISRLIQTPDHLDSWIDIAGYARCGVMVTEEYRALVDKSREVIAAAYNAGLEANRAGFSRGQNLLIHPSLRVHWIAGWEFAELTRTTQVA